MKEPKLALAMIIKGGDDDVQLLARCLNSVARYVDGIFITATKEKGGQTVALAKAFGAKVSFFQWVDDFAKARNFNFSQVSKDYNFIFWCDDDDVVVHAEKLRDFVRIMERERIDAVFMNYNYEIDEKTGQVLIVHPRERIVRNGVYEWKGALHETLIPKREVKTTFTNAIWINHFPPEERKKENYWRNVRILEKTYQEEGEKHDPRTEYYLARSYFDLGAENQEFLPKAEKLFWDYLEHSGWDEERAFAYNYLAEIYRIFKRYDDAIDCLLCAIKERPEFPTWYVNLGVIYGLKEDWDRALFWTQKGLETKIPQTAMVLCPRDDKVRALETIYLASIRKRKLDKAYEVALELKKLLPDDEIMDKRLKTVEELRHRVELAKSVHRLVKELDNPQEKSKIPVLLGTLPQKIVDNAYIEGLRQIYTPPKKWPKNSIVYFCGKGLEKWSPENLKTGIGGSETAVIHLSKQWAKMGYDVTVFGDPQEEKDYDGVHWRAFWRFNPADEFNILLIWRNPWILDTQFKAKFLGLDLHDVPNENEFFEERIKQIDKIFVKSKFHRNFLLSLPDEKFVIIPNGIDPDLFIWNKIKRNPYKLVYSSSYDRGLEYMLLYGWPIIKRAIPKAELHIFYGWNLFDKVYANNPERQLWKKKMVELMSQDGVFEHGRIGQKQLIKEKSTAVIHYYATTFEEIDAICVRESILAGCLPVTTNYAALKEKSYCHRVEGDPFDPETQEKVAKEIIWLLKNPSELKELVEKGKKLAEKETWENIAKEWTKIWKR